MLPSKNAKYSSPKNYLHPLPLLLYKQIEKHVQNLVSVPKIQPPQFDIKWWRCTTWRKWCVPWSSEGDHACVHWLTDEIQKLWHPRYRFPWISHFQIWLLAQLVLIWLKRFILWGKCITCLDVYKTEALHYTTSSHLWYPQWDCT